MLESDAKLKIQEEIRSGRFRLVWSYILDYENNQNPYQERKVRIKKWKEYAISNIEETSELIETASLLNQKGIQKIDSLHIACAILSKCEYFSTCAGKKLFKTHHENTKGRKHETRHEKQVTRGGCQSWDTYSYHILEPSQLLTFFSCFQSFVLS